MSVGKGEESGGSEGGSEEYEDEDEEFEGPDGDNMEALGGNKEGSAGGEVARPPMSHSSQQQQQQQVASSLEDRQQSGAAAGNNSFQRMGADRERASKGASASPMGMFLSPLLTFPHPSGHLSGHGEAENGRQLLFKDANVPRESHTDPLNNYYTSLLTSFPGAAACFKGGHDDPGGSDRRSFQTAEQPLRQILSDPISGELMDDAFIFPCGHSFGTACIQRIQETNVCYICQLPIRAEMGSPNLALRAAVQAFRLDRGFPKSSSSRAAKRRRDQDGAGEQSLDGGRPKGVQFPYVVSDRVLIKGNKRTPERFVGKEAIIKTQCLNGWYLVRTIDNGESVRLQYRSLQKIEDGGSWHHQEPAAAEFASVDLSTQSVENS